MISCDFAPNESWDDAILSLKLLFLPWRWKKGEEIEKAKRELLKLFQPTISNQQLTINFFFSGRSALYYLLKSLNLPKNSEIIVQAFTCEAVILPILANHLKPVYVDIEQSTFSINPIDLGKKITPKTKVLILQHTFGITPRYREKILSVVKRHNLLLIEDIAHGITISNFKFQISNSYLLMSFGRSKALSSVFGGATVTNNDTIAKKLNQIEKNLLQPSYWYIFKLLLYKPLAMLIKSTYDFGAGIILHKIFNFFNLMSPEITTKEKRGEYDNFFDKSYPNVLAILLLNQLKKFEKMQKQRKEIVNFYLKNLKKIFPNNQYLITNNFLIRFPLLVENRDEIIENAKKQNIFLGQWYNQAVAPKGLSLDKMEYKIDSCPAAEKISEKIINLPTNISQKEAEKIIEVISKD